MLFPIEEIIFQIAAGARQCHIVLFRFSPVGSSVVVYDDKLSATHIKTVRMSRQRRKIDSHVDPKIDHGCVNKRSNSRVGYYEKIVSWKLPWHADTRDPYKLQNFCTTEDNSKCNLQNVMKVIAYTDLHKDIWNQEDVNSRDVF